MSTNVTNKGRELAVALSKRISPERITQVLEECLSATMTTRSGTVEPDSKTRLAAASLALNYLVGKPVERSEVISVNMNADSVNGLEERLKSSPALQSALKGALERVQS